ncbi:MAG: hypothetical protein U0984_16200 [Prosthecobacter sp.]|nr:hypothetical protein [Prosthecobacter sp.]
MTATAPLASLADFSDRLSPMVVKELRQGLRTRMFGGVLLVLHLLLILITLVSGAARDAGETSWLLDGLSTLVLCVILPLRGFSALAEEIKANTLETLVLTRLSAARIVFGKWASLALQSLLVALSLMPYVVARYVFGGADLLGELGFLGLKWIAGMVIAAGIVCLSTQKQFWLRAVVVALVAFGPSVMAISYIFIRTFSPSGTSSFAVFGAAFGSLPPGWVLALAVIAGAAWLIFFFLSLAATRIAPAASHLAVVKRLVHAGTILILILVAWAATSLTTGLLIAAATVASMASMDALIETRNEVPSLLIPFYRRGLAGRVLAWFLTPGWPNGMVYSMAIACALALAALVMANAEAAMRAWMAVAGTWMCAALVHLICAGRWRDLLAPYIGMSLFLGVLQYFLMLIATTLAVATDVRWPGVLMPGTVEATLTFAKAKASSAEMEFLRLLGFGISCLWPLLLALIAALALHQTRHVRMEARHLAAES